MDLLTALIAFGAGAGATGLVGRWREHRSEPDGLADLLGWGFLVGEGIVLQKDGAFLAGWRYRGPDLRAATLDELDVLSRHVARAFHPYGDNWMFHVDVIRRPSTSYAPEGAFPDPVTRLIDEERRRSYTGARAYFENDYYLTATYLPPPELYSRLSRYFVRGNHLGEADWAGLLSGFTGALADLESRLSAQLFLERLTSDELTTYLHTCLTGLHHPVTAPAHGSYLGYVLVDQPLVGGFRPKSGQHCVRPIAIQGYPHATEGGLMDFLGTLGHPFRWSSRLIPLSEASAAKEIRRHRLGWLGKRKGAMALFREATGGHAARSLQAQRDDMLFMDGHAQTMVEDAAQAMAANASGEVRFAYYTSVLLVMEESSAQADHVAKALLKAVRDHGFTARVEDVNALEAFLGSLPGHGYYNLRRPVLSGLNIADLLPTTSVWPGEAGCPSPYFPAGSPALMWTATAGTTPFRLNLHDEDVGHTLVVGATGAGKSTLVNTLIAQWFRYEGAQAVLFDLGYSGYLLARAMGARHYDLAAGHADAVRLQPLRSVDDPAERSWAAEWLEVLFGLEGVDVAPGHRTTIDQALRLVAKSPPVHRTLTELSVQLQSQTLKAALRPYTVDGHLGYLLDAAEDDLVAPGARLEDGPMASPGTAGPGTADITGASKLGEAAEGGESASGGEDSTSSEAGDCYQVFELSHLMDLSDRVLVPVLLYLFRRVEARLSTGRPTLIVIEEAWAALMQSLFARRIQEWLLTLRKANAAVVLVAHSPAQISTLKNAHLLIGSCPTRIFLPTPDALDAENAALYHRLGLSPAETVTIGRARKKRDYYFTSPKGSRLFSLGLGDAARAFLGSRPGQSMAATIRQADLLIERHGSAWPGYWLDTCGLPEEAARFRKLHAAQKRGPQASPVPANPLLDLLATCPLPDLPPSNLPEPVPARSYGSRPDLYNPPE